MLLVCLKASPLWALDEPQAPANLCVGDSWTWKGNEFMASTPWLSQVVEIKSNEVSLNQTPRELLNEKHPIKARVRVRGADGNTLRNGDIKYVPHSQEFAFPLRVGKVWAINHHYNGDFGSSIHKTGEAKVVATEQLSTAAGNFETYRIEQRGQLITTLPQDWRATYQATYWYAPAAKSIVKYRYNHQNIRGNPSSSEGEIIALKLGNC